MRAPRVRPVVIAAGGTGGHFFPAEALAVELVSRGERVILLTDARMQARAAGFPGGEFHVLPGAGLAGRGWRPALAAAFALARGTLRARRILARIEPGVVVAFGGYPAVAPTLAALSLRPRPGLVLHEQNAVLGRANRFLAPRADVLAVSFEQTRRVPQAADWTLTGNPVRAEIAAVAARPYVAAGDAGPFRLLVLGGSLGARVFGTVIPTALAALPNATRKRIELALQCRAEDAADARTVLVAAGVAAEVAPFFADVPERLARAHLVIARAGASTVAELAASGRPAILVPLPGAIDDHQSANAAVIAAAGAGWVIAQEALDPVELAARIGDLMANPATLSRAAACGRALGRTNAASNLADLALSLARAEAPR
ncbi:MAG: undecaprenyldiphospho-muramoylpentapeptide beta-N-acetylglucosaminyltransferase [Acetobacteraceae bacterium]